MHDDPQVSLHVPPHVSEQLPSQAPSQVPIHEPKQLLPQPSTHVDAHVVPQSEHALEEDVEQPAVHADVQLDVFAPNAQDEVQLDEHVTPS